MSIMAMMIMIGAEYINKKWKIWNKMRDTGPEYVLAIKNADTAKVWQLENLFELQAEEIAVQRCLIV